MGKRLEQPHQAKTCLSGVIVGKSRDDYVNFSWRDVPGLGGVSPEFELFLLRSFDKETRLMVREKRQKGLVEEADVFANIVKQARIDFLEFLRHPCYGPPQ